MPAQHLQSTRIGFGENGWASVILQLDSVGPARNAAGFRPDGFVLGHDAALDVDCLAHLATTTSLLGSLNACGGIVCDMPALLPGAKPDG